MFSSYQIVRKEKLFEPVHLNRGQKEDWGNRMKNIIIALALLIAIAGAAGTYTDWQQGAVQGLKIGFHMGEMYTQASQGVNVTGFNSEVDKYNGWVQQNFGNDPALMMPKMSDGTALSKPVLIVNKTATGIVHTIDGSNNMTGPAYITNDMNLLPESARKAMESTADKAKQGGEYLGGV
jgi:hypothetical protein